MSTKNRATKLVSRTELDAANERVGHFETECDRLDKELTAANERAKQSKAACEQLDKHMVAAFTERDKAQNDLSMLLKQHQALSEVNAELYQQVQDLSRQVGKLEGYRERVEYVDALDRGLAPRTTEAPDVAR